MNLELDAILYEKDKRDQMLTEEDFILFKENDYLLETAYTGKQKFVFLEDNDWGGPEYTTSYGALFCFKNRDFVRGFILRLDHEISPERLGKSSCDTIYYTHNINVWKYNRYNKTIRLIGSIILYVLLLIGILPVKDIGGVPGILCLFAVFVSFFLSGVFLWTIVVGEYKLIKKTKLSEQNAAYIKIGKNDEALEKYCRKKEEEKYN